MSKRVVTSVRLTTDLHKWFKEEANRMGMSMNAYIAFALSQYKEQNEKVVK